MIESGVKCAKLSPYFCFPHYHIHCLSIRSEYYVANVSIGVRNQKAKEILSSHRTSRVPVASKRRDVWVCLEKKQDGSHLGGSLLWKVHRY